MRTWLKEKRTIKGMTQQEVADKSGIKRAYYTAIENGTRRPSPEVAQGIAKTLKFKWVIFFN
ncbi:helix-turn-helix transcriptional regulator [Dellaglioa algida]|uniref:helix-turn-helix transcriptional regulator n=1 Tax=Dellaglioa algida TaxID=105612 RepID=UPI0024C497FC|nr:helix-turn-helix transcriptional regulator [Dellaglioa algida]MDK1718686.1 helix-turn-helix transcriptional regulator [Dellaglioa algida]